MVIYFAPLEGLTDVIYRKVHHACFTGVTKYFIPFISPTQQLCLTGREKRAVSPEENAGVPVVAQILTKDSEHFVRLAQMLMDMGHREVNLNLGCPSGTVTAKGKGSAMLRAPSELERFLDDIYARSPIPVSIKTRIGYTSPEEWPRLLEIFLKYPMHEFIVHPRTRVQMYKGSPHRELCAAIPARAGFVYNGDLFTPGDCAQAAARFPAARALMLGRGLIANPALAQELTGGERLSAEALRAFHDKLFAAYAQSWPSNAVVSRMQGIMNRMCCCFENSKKCRKAIHKATSARAYLDAVSRLFGECPLKEIPAFSPEE